MALHPVLRELVRKSADKYGTAAEGIAEIKAELATEMDISWDAEKEGRIDALLEEHAVMVSDFFETDREIEVMVSDFFKAAKEIERLERGQERLHDHITYVEATLRELGVTGKGAGFLSSFDDETEEEAA